MENFYPQKSSKKGYFIVAIAAFLLGWQATASGLMQEVGAWIGVSETQEEKEVVANIREQTDMSLYWLVWSELNKKYLHDEDLDEKEMVYGSIKGLVESLKDPYTVFMTPEESRQFNDSLEGKLEGIGAELTIEEDQLVIVSPLRDSPAEKAGLLPGDVIYKVGDEFTYEMTLFEAIMQIRGEKGTTVNLTILRDGLEDPFEVSIIRDDIDLESVSMEELDGQIAYISVNQFNDKTIDEFNSAISELILDEPDGLIIDLRFNGGGYLDIAVELLSFVLPSGTEAVRIDRRDAEEEVLETNGNAKLLDVPLVVLVNEGSASASEIFAGAVQDHKRGIIMGTQSYGKGTVQEVESFNDGSSMRMTIAQWLTPDGRSINKTGVTPDIIVEISDEDLENEYDRQKERAAEYLRNL